MRGVTKMVDCDEVKSEFIRKKAKKSEDKGYIDDLIFLEKAIVEGDGRLGRSRVIKLSSLKEHYKKEYEAIYKELNLEGWEKEKAREKREARRRFEKERMNALEEKKEMEKEKRSWIKASEEYD